MFDPRFEYPIVHTFTRAPPLSPAFTVRGSVKCHHLNLRSCECAAVPHGVRFNGTHHVRARALSIVCASTRAHKTMYLYLHLNVFLSFFWF